MIANAVSGSGAPAATTVTKGIVEISKTATDVTRPIAVSATEPIYTGNTGVRSIAEFNNLAAAVTAIG